MSITAVLCLPRLSSSLSYRAYREEITGAPLLAWWARAVSTMPGVKGTAVLVRSETEASTVQPLLRGTSTGVHVCRHHSTTRSLAAFAAESCESTIAIVSFALPLGPWRLLEHAFAHHLRTRSEVTEVKGLPTGVPPVFFEAAALDLLSQIKVPGVPANPLELYGRVLSLGTQAAKDLGLTGVSVPFDGAARYRREGEVLPRAVEIWNAEDVETLRRVMAKAGRLACDDTSLLALWLQEQGRDRRAQARFNARRGCSQVPNKDDRPRILYVSNPSAVSGAEHSLIQMVGRIDPHRFDRCALVGAEGQFSEALKSRGLHVVCTNFDFGTGLADDYVYVSEALRRLQPSIIHLNSLSGSAVLAAAAELSIPIVCHVRNRPGDGYLEALSYSTAAVAVSEFIKSEVMQFGIPEDRIHVIYSAVEPGEFRRSQFDRKANRALLGLKDDSKMIVMVARLTPYKRHDLMIAALPYVRAAVPSASVFAFGDAQGEQDYVQALEDRIEKQGLTDCFRLLPFQRDLKAYYAAADAFVLCSDFEPLGRSVVEALAMETPVVVTDSGGPVEIVQHNETGLVARSGDAQSIAQCLIATLTDPAAAKERAQAGRGYVEKCLTAQVTADQVMRLYTRLLRSSGPRTVIGP
jgi:glycosyltransferase involved in cell wall biosynthesis